MVAAAALLVSTPGFNKAEAASPAEVQAKVYHYQSGQISQDQLNSMLKKYKTSLENVQNGNQSIYQFIDHIQKQINDQLAQREQVPVDVEQPAQESEQAEQPEEQQPVQEPEQAEHPTQEPETQQPAQEPEQVEQPAEQPAQQQPVQTEQPQAETPVSSTISAFEQQVLELTNQERAKQGLPALQLDVELSKVAREKSNDMQTKGYFDHNSPTYGSPFDMMKAYGISYRTAGENIAMGQRTPEEVVNAWMNSEGHRANILNPNFTHIGIGHVAQGNYWTQMFIGK